MKIFFFILLKKWWLLHVYVCLVVEHRVEWTQDRCSYNHNPPPP